MSLIVGAPFRSRTRVHKDYRSVVLTALVAIPFDEEWLHDCVCTYVRAERDRGRSATEIIVALTEVVEQKGIALPVVRHSLTLGVIPWCIEAYFPPRAAGTDRPAGQ